MGVDGGYYRTYLLAHLSFIAASGLSLMKHPCNEKIPVAMYRIL